MDSSTICKKEKDRSCLIKDKDDLERIKLFAYEVCAEYLGGKWEKIDLVNFKLTRVKGGLSNYLYKCELDDLNGISGDEPNCVLIRLYGEYREKTGLFMDIVQTSLIGENRLGPEVYGLFDEGRIEEFINAPNLKHEDYYNLEISRSVAMMLGDFHLLKMPFSKKANWLFPAIENWLEQTKHYVYKNDKDIELYEQIKTFNLDSEYKKLKPILINIGSPVVFCHNDLSVNNILMLPNKLMAIDYEFSCYNYRGFDFGLYFSEAAFNNHSSKYPYFEFDFEKYPNKDQQLNFVRSYIDKIRKNAIETSIKSHNAYLKLDEEVIIYEANMFALIAFLYAALWSTIQSTQSSHNFGFLEFGIARLTAYFQLKKKLFPDGYND